jgi:hypothetical protein
VSPAAHAVAVARAAAAAALGAALAGTVRAAAAARGRAGRVAATGGRFGVASYAAAVEEGAGGGGEEEAEEALPEAVANGCRVIVLPTMLSASRALLCSLARSRKVKVEMASDTRAEMANELRNVQAMYVNNLPDVKHIFMCQQAAFNNFFEHLDFEEVSMLTRKVHHPNSGYAAGEV